ncbi:hypothetical protein VT85_12365 [Planctomyces sp. SH-PL62]|nr:hypothetical protein VT85_12365 [Planctomyces sp. SH-PL62]
MRAFPLAAAAPLPTSGRPMIHGAGTSLERPGAAAEIAADGRRLAACRFGPSPARGGGL